MDRTVFSDKGNGYYIDMAWLRKHNACSEGRAWFIDNCTPRQWLTTEFLKKLLDAVDRDGKKSGREWLVWLHGAICIEPKYNCYCEACQPDIRVEEMLDNIYKGICEVYWNDKRVREAMEA
jgi:hypothetical protein